MAHPRVASLALVVLGLSSLAQTGCAAMGFRSSDKKLVQQASFDHKCPVEKVRVVQKMEGGMGDASFVVDVCGTERRYKRMGTAYYDVEKGSPLGT
ncbi:MAG TPA: hypothetical protein VFG69_11975 [Nannocystaceae bacterium]|nr:hypothetical protein [Nannocystaceae bacterium]